ncbi:MAG: hypothetical protein HOA22_07410 [Gammaproteobacteria bacterium]|nr:hypothetical protein [Gammaproteobacteria bacterium]
MDLLSIAGFALNLYSRLDEQELKNRESRGVVEQSMARSNSTAAYPARKIPVSELLEGKVRRNSDPITAHKKSRQGEKSPQKIVKPALIVAKKRHQSESGVDGNGHYFLRRKPVISPN